MSNKPKNTKFKSNSGKSTSYKKGKGNSKPRPRKEDSMDMDVKPSQGDINNPSYYYESADVLDQVMNFSFNEYGGVPTTFVADSDGSITEAAWNNHMVATYWVNPSIPETADTSSPTMDGATTAALRNFLKLSGSNAKTTNYAPQDVSILILALAEIIKIAVFISRIFGIVYLFNYRNRTYPETLLRAMGIDVDDLRANLADYRVRFNSLLAVASKIPFPADIPIFRKAADLFANIYLDDNDSALAQTYMLCPYSTWRFNEAYDSNGAGLETIQVVSSSSLKGMNQILDTFESMISALLTSTSLNYIYSDVMRCHQKGYITQLLTFSAIPENHVVVPIFNEEVRDWLHNAVIMGVPLASSAQVTTGLKFSTLTPNNDVSCMAAVNKLLYHPQFKMSTKFGYTALIDFTHDNVSIEEKVRATRFAHRWNTIKSGSAYYTNELAFNDEYIVEVDYYIDATNAAPDLKIASTWNGAPGTIAGFVHLEDVTSKFDWSPIQYRTSTDAVLGDIVKVIGDLDYYTLTDYWLMKKMYDYEIIHLMQIG